MNFGFDKARTSGDFSIPSTISTDSNRTERADSSPLHQVVNDSKGEPSTLRKVVGGFFGGLGGAVLGAITGAIATPFSVLAVLMGARQDKDQGFLGALIQASTLTLICGAMGAAVGASAGSGVPLN